MIPGTVSTCARIIVLATAGAMSTCAPDRDHYYDPPRHAPATVYLDYWYYPAIGSHYDPRARIYIYYTQGRWLRASALPSHVHPYRGSHVVVRSRRDRPYDEHLAHRRQYVSERYIVRQRNADRDRHTPHSESRGSDRGQSQSNPRRSGTQSRETPLRTASINASGAGRDHAMKQDRSRPRAAVDNGNTAARQPRSQTG